MKYKDYDSLVKKRKFESLWSDVYWYIKEELLENTKEGELDDVEYKRDFYDYLEDIAMTIKVKKGY